MSALCVTSVCVQMCPKSLVKGLLPFHWLNDILFHKTGQVGRRKL